MFTAASNLILKGRPRALAPLPVAENDPSRSAITLLALVISPDDRKLLADIASRSHWNLLLVHTHEEARAAVDQLKPPIVLCDRDLPGKAWQDAVETLASSSHPTCIVLISREVDEYLWNETARRGGYDVLI
jgi:hypothetical protein